MKLKTKKVYRDSANYNHADFPGEKNTDPSLTKPDMAMTIPEILKRFASGRSVDVPFFDDYSGDHDHLTGVDVRQLDISEVHDLLIRSQDNVQKLRLEQNRRRQADLDAKLEASIIEKYEARKKAENKPEKPLLIQPVLPGMEPPAGS